MAHRHPHGHRWPQPPGHACGLLWELGHRHQYGSQLWSDQRPRHGHRQGMFCFLKMKIYNSIFLFWCEIATANMWGEKKMFSENIFCIIEIKILQYSAISDNTVYKTIDYDNWNWSRTSRLPTNQGKTCCCPIILGTHGYSITLKVLYRDLWNDLKTWNPNAWEILAMPCVL